MKTLIICISIHNKNTLKIAKTMAEVLNAELLKPNEVEINALSRYDLIGFGSGIYFGKHHKSLLNLTDKLPNLSNQKGFIFSTSGVSNAGNFIHNIRHRVSHFHSPLRKKLVKKGFDIVGEFTCRGLDTVGPLKIIGGISKAKPNENDIENTKNFVRKLKGGKIQDNKRIKKEKSFWDKLSPKYDKFIEKYWKIYDSKLLDKIYQDVNIGSTVLEVACGTGLVTLEVAKKAEKVYGIDIAPQMIKKAKKKMKEKRTENIEFSVEDAYALPFSDNMFDTVICNNALHNMKYPEKAISEIKRVLRPEGKFITSIVGIGEKLRFKIIMTISTIIGQLPVFHKLKLDEFTDFVHKSEFDI